MTLTQYTHTQSTNKIEFIESGTTYANFNTHTHTDRTRAEVKETKKLCMDIYKMVGTERMKRCENEIDEYIG